MSNNQTMTIMTARRMVFPVVCMLGASLITGAVHTTWAAERSAAGSTAELTLIHAAAEAMGGKDRILAVKTVRIAGYGKGSYQHGGGNISPSLHAPERAFNITQDRVLDYANNRMRVQQRSLTNFVFVSERAMRGSWTELGFDGDVAFTVQDGKPIRSAAATLRAHRLEMLNNPIGILRAALHPESRLENLRTIDQTKAVDLVTPQGDRLTLAIDATTQLPAWVEWVQPNGYLGDLTLRTHFLGYQVEKGIQLPSGYHTISDFRNVVHQSIDVDRTFIDAPGDILGPAPEAVRAAPVPLSLPRIDVQATAVAKGVWYLQAHGNSTVFEFSDHLLLFEPFGFEARMLAILQRANALVPGKRVTKVIASHHHLDHNGGLRAAVAEGLQIITHRDNVDLLRELASRPAKVFPDALGRNPRPMDIIAVDDKLVLKDDSMEVQVLRAMANNHMASAVFAYVPHEKLIAQGDLFDESWEMVWWGNSYPDSVKHWNIQVEKDLAVHGNINSYERVLQLLRQQTDNAKRFCERTMRDDYAVQGCPAVYPTF